MKNPSALNSQPSSKHPARPSATAPRPCVVAIVGGSGAGKSWLVQRLLKFFGDRACHVQLDDFYLDRSNLPWGRHKFLNFDIPASIDWTRAERVIRDCRAGRTPRMPRYDFVTHRTAARADWQLRPIVLVEGLWLLRRRRLRPLFDLKIYIDVPAVVRVTRRIKRDVAERGFTIATARRALRTQVLPLHLRFVASQQRYADLVLRQPYGEDELTVLAAHLWRLSNDAAEPMPHRFFVRLRRLLRAAK